MNLRAWLKEPLVHFLAAGALLFIGASALAPSGANRTIVIDEARLIEHLQARAQLYDPQGFEELLTHMSDKDRAKLVREAAVEEALYREGSALNLADADPLVRRRVVQQMRQLLLQERAADITVSDEEIAAQYRENPSDYGLPERISFSHVFFSAAEHGAAAEHMARAALSELKGEPFQRANRHGDRFLYQSHYVDAAEEEITSQFGEDFAKALFALDQSPGWQGPIQSEHGWHLVGISRKLPAEVPPLADIRSRVREDALMAKRENLLDDALDALLSDYDIEVADGIAPD